MQSEPLESDSSERSRPLAGQHAIVTGGGRGIGLAIARELAALGANITLVGRDRERLLASLTRMTDEFGGLHHAEPADVRDAQTAQRVISDASQRSGPPTILVNNAGAAQSQPFERMSDALWHDMIAVNLTGTYNYCRAAVPAMMKAGRGRIVNIASVAGQRGYSYVAAYCAAKHGVIGLTRALAVELARRNITVNAVCPGYAETDMTEATIANIVAKTGRTAEQARAELTRASPLGRLVTGAEVAAAVAFLCMPGAVAITGQAISVSGGETMP
ncbi:MAG: SDR family oxidoreductase [Alphaproteobacteria bacterium]|nr:SDR family oxidoreductase [Alphaproteobacteria bacterium]